MQDDAKNIQPQETPTPMEIADKMADAIREAAKEPQSPLLQEQLLSIRGSTALGDKGAAARSVREERTLLTNGYWVGSIKPLSAMHGNLRRAKVLSDCACGKRIFVSGDQISRMLHNKVSVKRYYSPVSLSVLPTNTSANTANPTNPANPTFVTLTGNVKEPTAISICRHLTQFMRDHFPDHAYQWDRVRHDARICYDDRRDLELDTAWFDYETGLYQFVKDMGEIPVLSGEQSRQGTKVSVSLPDKRLQKTLKFTKEGICFTIIKKVPGVSVPKHSISTRDYRVMGTRFNSLSTYALSQDREVLFDSPRDFATTLLDPEKLPSGFDIKNYRLKWDNPEDNGYNKTNWRWVLKPLAKRHKKSVDTLQSRLHQHRLAQPIFNGIAVSHETCEMCEAAYYFKVAQGEGDFDKALEDTCREFGLSQHRTMLDKII